MSEEEKCTLAKDILEKKINKLRKILKQKESVIRQEYEKLVVNEISGESYSEWFSSISEEIEPLIRKEFKLSEDISKIVALSLAKAIQHLSEPILSEKALNIKEIIKNMKDEDVLREVCDIYKSWWTPEKITEIQAKAKKI